MNDCLEVGGREGGSGGQRITAISREKFKLRPTKHQRTNHQLTNHSLHCPLPKLRNEVFHVSVSLHCHIAYYISHPGFTGFVVFSEKCLDTYTVQLFNFVISGIFVRFSNWQTIKRSKVVTMKSLFSTFSTFSTFLDVLETTTGEPIDTPNETIIQYRYCTFSSQ